MSCSMPVCPARHLGECECAGTPSLTMPTQCGAPPAGSLRSRALSGPSLGFVRSALPTEGSLPKQASSLYLSQVLLPTKTFARPAPSVHLLLGGAHLPHMRISWFSKHWQLPGTIEGNFMKSIPEVTFNGPIPEMIEMITLPDQISFCYKLIVAVLVIFALPPAHCWS